MSRLRHGPTGTTRRARIVLVLLLVGLGVGPAALASEADAGQQGAGIEKTSAVLADQLDASSIPGGAVVVVRDGDIEARGVGRSGHGAVTPDTPFVIGSASKSFAALAVVQLADRGRVDLDAPVREYVPEFQLAAGQPIDDITVRDLLQQTSGIDDLAGGALLASAADGTPAQAIAELEDAHLASTPGKTWRYANANYVLAGLVVEHASGLHYGDYVQQKILTPLGMTHSSANTDPAGSDVLAEGHQFWFGVPVTTEPTRRHATLAAGYLISTAEDLGRYLSLYLDGGLGPDGNRIVSKHGVRTLLTGGPDAALGPWADGRESHYAMGWFVGGPWGEDAIFHPGNTPDTTTMLALFPDQGVAVAVLVDAGNELPVPGNPFIADRVTRNVVHAALGQPVPNLPSVRRFYLVFDLVALLLLGLASWGLLRAVRGLTSPSTPRHSVRRWTGVVIRTLAVGLLLLAPTSSYGWGGLWTWAPDLAVLIAALALLLAAAAAVRLIALLRSRHTIQTTISNTTKGEHDHVPA